MRKSVFPFRLSLLAISLGMSLPASAQSSSEKKQICEVKPIMKCLDKEKIEGTTIKVPADAAAIAKDGFLICDSSFNYTTAPDIVLIMDNTGSMDSVKVVNGIPRWCEFPDKEVEDPGCISGDPRRQRGPALQTFLDSALAKGGKGVKVGVVTFSETAEAKSDTLLPLTAASLPGIKASITMTEDGQTNYTAAFRAAMNLLKSSKKPKEEQFIIFVSDGRPNFPKRPDGDPYMYKAFLDSLPTVHSIFLGDNAANYNDMKDISFQTHGEFFHIPDVGLLAKFLTDDLAKKLFRRASPTLTRIRNHSDSAGFQTDISYDLDASEHVFTADSLAYTLQMPGPLYLRKGINDIVVKTEYGYGGTTQDVHFKIERSATGPFSDLESACRDLPKLILYNTQNQAINLLSLPYSITDSLLRYSLTTAAPSLDSFDILVRTSSPSTAQQDLELVHNSNANRKDSTWSATEPFQHQTVKKTQGDRQIQVDHGESVFVTYKNPFIPEDSAEAKVKIKYGPDFNRAAYWDLNGDGRIETVDIRFQEGLANLPDQLRFHIADASGAASDRMALASGGEIKFAENPDHSPDRAHLIVTLSNPFDYGVTSVAFPDTSGRTFRQLDIPMVDAIFRVDDSVPPVIIKADVVKPDKDNPLPRIIVTYSEPITLDPSVAREPIIIRRDTVVFTSAQIPIASVERLSDRQYAFNLAAGGEYKPVGGDSVAVNNNGETRDLSGRAPAVLTFAPMGGAAPSQSVTDFYVTFANGSRSDAKGAPDAHDPDHILIPVDAKGYALPGHDDGKCENCNPKQGDLFTGSVITVVTKYPVVYDFAIYSNLGQVVAKAGGRISEDDLKLLDKKEDPSHDPNLTEYTQRIVWTGRTSSGTMAGTGAYVLKATFHYERSFKTGARPSLNTKYTKFGFLRECCNGSNVRWFD